MRRRITQQTTLNIIPAIFTVVGFTDSWTTGITITSDVNDLTIDWGDGSAIESITQNVEKIHNYTVGTYECKIYTKSSKITSFRADGSKLRELHFNSRFDGDNIDVSINFLTLIKFNALDNIIRTILNVRTNNLTILDLSNVLLSIPNTGSNGLIYYNNAQLTKIIFSNLSNTIGRQLSGYNCGSITQLDFSNVIINVSTFFIYSCPSLSNIIFKVGNILSSNTRLDSCAFNNGVDFNNVDVLNNIVIQLQNNNMTAAGVNLSLVTRDLDSATGGSFNIAGTNAAPDATSGGYDGLAAKASLTAKGVTVTTN